MRTPINKVVDKKRRVIIKKEDIISPNLNELHKVILSDRKTEIYFHKNKSKEYIQEKVELYEKTLCSTTIVRNEAYQIKGVNKNGGIDG